MVNAASAEPTNNQDPSLHPIPFSRSYCATASIPLAGGDSYRKSKSRNQQGNNHRDSCTEHNNFDL